MGIWELWRVQALNTSSWSEFPVHWDVRDRHNLKHRSFTVGSFSNLDVGNFSWFSTHTRIPTMGCFLYDSKWAELPVLKVLRAELSRPCCAQVAAVGEAGRYACCTSLVSDPIQSCWCLRKRMHWVSNCLWGSYDCGCEILWCSNVFPKPFEFMHIEMWEHRPSWLTQNQTNEMCRHPVWLGTGWSPAQPFGLPKWAWHPVKFRVK